MGWFTACVLYAITWWTVLFAVLPLGARPVSEADPLTGWRGAPARPRLIRIVVLTTLIALALWAAMVGVIESGWLSFRHGILGMPQNYT